MALGPREPARRRSPRAKATGRGPPSPWPERYRPAARYSARTSAGSRSRSSPRGAVRAAGPNADADQWRTGSPTASSIRRTSRFRPSPITSRTAAFPADLATDRAEIATAVPSSSSTPRRSRAKLPLGRRALDLRQVLLLHPVAGMRQAVGLAVVCEDQQPLGVAVQPPHGEDPGPGRSRRRSDAACGSRIVVVTPIGLCSTT